MGSLYIGVFLLGIAAVLGWHLISGRRHAVAAGQSRRSRRPRRNRWLVTRLARRATARLKLPRGDDILFVMRAGLLTMSFVVAFATAACGGRESTSLGNAGAGGTLGDGGSTAGGTSSGGTSTAGAGGTGGVVVPGDVTARAAMIGRGVNLGNMLEAPNEGDWGTLVKDYYFTMIRDKGFDSVRIPIKWSGHSQTTAPYTIDPTFLARVDQVLDWGVASGLTIVINIHHFDQIMTDAQGSRAWFLALWTQLSAHYKDLPDSVMFELLNEPNGDLSDQAFLDSMYADAIRIIRADNPTRTIIAGGLWWNSSGSLADLTLPTGENNVIGTFHMYVPMEFTHSGATWIDPVPAPGATWTGTASERAQIDNEFTQALRFNESTGLPVFMGEFGAFSGADQASRVRWTTYVVDAAARSGVVWTYWEFNSGFGITDPTTDAWHEDLVGALLH